MRLFKHRKEQSRELPELPPLDASQVDWDAFARDYPELAARMKPTPQPQSWDNLDTVVTRLRSLILAEKPNGQASLELIEDDFTIRQACEGISIMGGIGSGKTSGSGAQFARAYLRAGFGGLVLCAKNDEAELWREYAKATGREGGFC